MAVAHGGVGVHPVAAEAAGDGALLPVEGEVGAPVDGGRGDGPLGAVQRAVLGPAQAHGVAGPVGEGEAAVVHLGRQGAVGERAGEGPFDVHGRVVAGHLGGRGVAERDPVAVDDGVGAEGVAAVAALGPAVVVEGEVRPVGGAVGGAVDGEA